MADSTDKTINITPRFVYTEPVEILARFIDELSSVQNNDDAWRDVMTGGTGVGIYAAREAMRELLVQDIELQIANKTFPLPRRPR